MPLHRWIILCFTSMMSIILYDVILFVQPCIYLIILFYFHDLTAVNKASINIHKKFPEYLHIKLLYYVLKHILKHI